MRVYILFWVDISRSHGHWFSVIVPRKVSTQSHANKLVFRGNSPGFETGLQ